MMIVEFTEDKFGKAMKAISKITEHADCLQEIFEDLAEDSEFGNRYGNRKRYDDDDMYSSRYGMRGGRR
jgi:Asp-tRNA(Asn)/Glu-tRNA(Gln) amidotransferase C subunit